MVKPTCIYEFVTTNLLFDILSVTLSNLALARWEGDIGTRFRFVGNANLMGKPTCVYELVTTSLLFDISHVTSSKKASNG